MGRWLAYMARGRFRHDPIAASPAVRGERLIGWTAHYLIGIAFAAVLLARLGPRVGAPADARPGTVVGIGSVAAPFLVMQPGMGAGIAASRTPRPGAARFQCLVTHTIFGLGLYAAGLVPTTSQENEMRIPVRFASIVFGALLSAIMVALVSAFVIAVTQGLHPGFAAQWSEVAPPLGPSPSRPSPWSHPGYVG